MTEPEPTTGATAAAAPRAGRGSPLRVAVWVWHMVLPLLTLWLLLAVPSIDVAWQHNPTHFWLVAAVAVVNVLLSLRITEEAGRAGDARLFLVAMAFLASVSFFGLHALATPAMMVEGGNTGFMLASPVGLAIAAVLVLTSSFDLSTGMSARVMSRRTWFRYGLLALVAVWAFLSLNEIAPLDSPLEPDRFRAVTAPIAIVTVALYGVAAWRYHRVHRRRPSSVTLALITSFVLLVEAMVVVTVSRSWQLSWWLWHLLTVAGYGYVAYAAYVELRAEGKPVGLFVSAGLDRTVERLRREYRTAVSELLEALEDPEARRDVEGAARDLGTRFALSEGQVEVLVGAADAITAQRRRTAVLAAMSRIAREARVGDVGDEDLAVRAVSELSAALGRPVSCRYAVGGEERRVPPDAEQQWPEVDRAGLDAGRTVAAAAPDGGTVVALPVDVAGQVRAVFQVWLEPGAPPDRDRRLLESFVDQVAVSLENLRLYRELRGLFGRYVSPEVASRLLADPSKAELGGSTVETTVLFADLRGFTSMSEDLRRPEDVVALLNRYFSAVVPIVLGEGGTIDKFVGDAVMALFNTPVVQPDHALRAARAAVRMQRAIEQVAAERPDWPRFRIGINTGPALVGNIGSDELRNFTAVGDAVNVASRLETTAEPGQILIGATTFALIRHAAEVRSAGSIEVKGKDELVDAYVLLDVDGA